jgi:hypothetical protein
MAYDDAEYPTKNADKFVWEPGDLQVLGMCLACIHKKPANACAAFPNGIPEEITWGDFDHRQEYPGDGGVRFQARPGVDIDKVWRLRQGAE